MKETKLDKLLLGRTFKFMSAVDCQPELKADIKQLLLEVIDKTPLRMGNEWNLVHDYRKQLRKRVEEL